MNTPVSIRSVSRALAFAAGAASFLALSGCVVPEAMGEPAPRRAMPPPSSPEPRVFAYPMRGQDSAQQDRDRYECHNWAVSQSGFDPGRGPVSDAGRPATAQNRADAAQSAAVTAAVGAVIGAIAAPKGDAAKGAIVGAAAGGLLGAAAAEAEAAESGRAAVRRDAAEHRRGSAEYRRAMAACLEGRGYSVR